MVPEEIRKRYAEDIRSTAKIGSETLLQAFACVPREDFVGSAPWTLLAQPVPGQMQPQITKTSDPVDLYKDVAVVPRSVKELDQRQAIDSGAMFDLFRLWLGAIQRLFFSRKRLLLEN